MSSEFSKLLSRRWQKAGSVTIALLRFFLSPAAGVIVSIFSAQSGIGHGKRAPLSISLSPEPWLRPLIRVSSDACFFPLHSQLQSWSSRPDLFAHFAGVSRAGFRTRVWARHHASVGIVTMVGVVSSEWSSSGTLASPFHTKLNGVHYVY